MTLAAQFYVATTGNDDHDGSKEAPFLTITKAQVAVRDFIRNGMNGDVTVFVYGGTYYVTHTWKLDERDSGRDGYRVSYQNVPGEVVNIIGGRVVTNWEPYQLDKWRAYVGQGNSFQTMYADGERIVKARLPATGYFQTDGEPASSNQEGIQYRAGDIPNGCDLSQAQVFIWPGKGEWNWFSELRKLKSHDDAARYMQFQRSSIWGIGEGSRYFIQGSIDFLQAPGQFHLDEVEGWLYYQPKMGSPLQQEIIVPTVTRLIEMRGNAHDEPIQHLLFQGLRFSCTDFWPEYQMIQENEGLSNVERDEHREGLFYLNYAADIEIKDCEILNSGSSGIFMDQHTLNIQIIGNLIEHMGYIGICASGYSPLQGSFTSPTEAYTNKEHQITNNRIRHGGELIGHGCGIMLYQSGNNEITHNLISHMPRYGISLKGLRHKVMPESCYGIPVTWDNHWDFLHTRNNRIAYNDISNVMMDSQDGGMIESWGVGAHNTIHGNRLHDSGIHFSFGFGIYLDDASDYFTVTQNVLTRLYSTGDGKLWMLIFSKGIGNLIQGNLLVDNPDAISAIGTQEMAGEENKDVTVKGNIIYNSGYLYYFVNWRDDKFAEADYNLYWQVQDQGMCHVAGQLPLPSAQADLLGRYVYNLQAWQTLLGGKFDAHTRIADPLFIQSGDGKMRLHPNSPAYTLGWVDIDENRIGPQ
ncbi:right-handed parallel beta-helix repeat-containing protein [Paenibacillus roseipurpureus]|uniref:Right-handed parallel beta-helix repeat-containing protein n=1 Tax=Paenibacillus roseopurpureus TaxID=2918901 RepID=A0AA96LPR2_9BACL|nr:right-handed parallel beta-helix repeat-containing protein [Paenibacillus sp. MBLB1832]WNR42640.1 right-handed parallel beta-helix repeat-containing protein [Paenibacillus sp. MBLB1832]